ncbi:hypothetical protein BO71DRAFT_425478 [Aspergillus ellipticus CBS 707.79]|uniref:Uncharacterized protein n=1 Tax=Aspergillus ellipticus CBS 707.79 TaxID=1448320 RepID=A0A319DN62_9EURO|nr:hypothetical protein BO71DRAFT_425478 [Aspergillus ellipticus CBS 707.79]
MPLHEEMKWAQADSRRDILHDNSSETIIHERISTTTGSLASKRAPGVADLSLHPELFMTFTILLQIRGPALNISRSNKKKHISLFLRFMTCILKGADIRHLYSDL